MAAGSRTASSRLKGVATIVLAAAVAAVAAHLAVKTLSPEPPLRMEASYAFDVSDPRELVGSADNVFVGRVVEEVGGEDIAGEGGGDIPQTQFAVDVVENLKGELRGQVVVNQDGGTLPGESRPILLTGSEPLEPGESYVLSTSRDVPSGWHSIVATGFGDVPVSTEPNPGEVLARYRQAVRNQVEPKL